MVVQHNLTAMNSNRMLNITSRSQAKSTEKLSSGFKINRAADDAAGLSISEKMRKQIRGLSQASANAQDGISAVQTAEGALNEVQDMLQRMNELAVKAANGTNSEDDRTYIQNEIDQLVSEVDRVAETTKFNETYLLKGDKDGTKQFTNSYKALTADTSTITNDASKATNASTTLVKGETGSGSKWYDAATGTEVSTADLAGKYGISLSAATSKAGDTIDYVKGVGGTINHNTAFALYDANGNKISKNALDSYLTATDATPEYLANKKLYLNKEGTVEAKADDITAMTEGTQTKDAAVALNLHVGADATTNNQISVKIESMNAKSIGISGLKVDGTDDKNALDAIETVKASIQMISTQRSALGAIQNRLEHTINNLDNVVENTTSAESAIRDTDMASEMVRYSNNNIIAQAGQAMLAQANQSNQGVLSLLS